MHRDANQHDRPIPVILNIDVEPDAFLVELNSPNPWLGFEFCHDYFRDYRHQLEQATGYPVHFNWMLRMDPQIAAGYGTATWVVDNYQPFFDQVQALSDSIGLHVHNYRWSDQLRGWTDDSANLPWMTECLETAVEAYRQAFGKPATTLSIGNFWLSTELVNLAEQLGIEYDNTLEPGLLSKPGYGGRHQTAPTPSFTRVPRVPYVPSRQDFRQPSRQPETRTITLIPLTSAYKKLGFGPRDIRARTGRLLRNGMRGRWQSTPLAMVQPWEGENSFGVMLERAEALQQNPYLAFTVRSNIHKDRFARIDPSLQALLAHCQKSDLRFCTQHEAMAQLSANAGQAAMAAAEDGNRQALPSQL